MPDMGDNSRYWSGAFFPMKIRTTDSEVRVTDPETGGQKGQKPEQYSLIPTEALAAVARVYGYGAEKYTTYGKCTCVNKYPLRPDGKPNHESGCDTRRVVTEGRNNWRLGYAWHLSYDALQRHLAAFWGGEDDDPESGLPHLAHAIFHCMTLLTYTSDPKYKSKDDRA